MSKMRFLRLLTAVSVAANAAALAIGGKQMHVERESDGLQDTVSLVLCWSKEAALNLLLLTLI